MVQKTKAKKKAKKKTNKKITQRQKKIRLITLLIVIILIVIIAIILFLTSSIFDIKSIMVENNEKLSSEEIVQASTLQIGENRLRKSKRTIAENIKTLPYIENVKIIKKLNGEIHIKVEERVATYMLQYDNKYAYIDNQGYILEISETPVELPILANYSSKEIIPGQRLELKDLRKLDEIIKIVEASRSQGIANLITEINIEDERDYIIKMPTQKKTIEFGDISNLNVKILNIVEVLKKTEGKEGTILIKNRVSFIESFSIP